MPTQRVFAPKLREPNFLVIEFHEGFITNGGFSWHKVYRRQTLNKLILSFSEDDYVLLERYFLQMKSEVSCPLLFNFIRPCAFAHLSLKNKDKWRTWGVGLFNSITAIMLRLALGGVFFFYKFDISPYWFTSPYQ